MATSTFTIVLTFTGANQGIADTTRDDALADYCAARNLERFLIDGNGQLTTTIDPAKAAASIRTDVRQQMRDVVIAYRANKAAMAAQLASQATEAVKVVIT